MVSMSSSQRVNGPILITGGGGFIGSHLVDRLKLDEPSREIHVVDNLQTATARSWLEGKALLIQGDVRDKEFVSSLAKHNYFQIYHMACPASPVHYQIDGVGTLLTSVVGTYNLLELAKSCDAEFLFASTSEVYGDPKEHPQKESYVGHVNCIGLRACYDEGKRAAESLCMDHHRQYGTKVHIIRIFNTYGPRMNPHDGRVVSNFIVQALNGNPISIYGDGSQTRSFCFVSDLVDGIIRMMNIPGVLGPINLGNPGEFTVRELAEQVQDLVHGDNNQQQDKVSDFIEYRPLPSDDPKQRRPDITNAQKILGWTPKVTLQEGLKFTVQDFANRKATEGASFCCSHQKECLDVSTDSISLPV